MTNIIFFDGLCPFCHFWVQFVIKVDRKQQFLFASLQGTTSENLLPAQFLEVDSVVMYVNKRKIYTKSNAVFTIIRALGGVWKLLLVFQFLPKSLLNLLYDFVAKYRYILWKPMDQCPLPDPKVATRFLA